VQRLNDSGVKRTERKFKVSSNQDQARLIAERVARRLSREPNAGDRGSPAKPNTSEGIPEHRRARIVNFVSSSAPTRTQSSIGSAQGLRAEARSESSEPSSEATETFFHPQVAQSPWLAPFSRSQNESSPQVSNRPSATDNRQLPSHPSEQRFGVDEAVVSELVEFFEAEKQCSIDPSGKPCDHCAMCSSRGF
jgi:hypothetical protein